MKNKILLTSTIVLALSTISLFGLAGSLAATKNANTDKALALGEQEFKDNQDAIYTGCAAEPGTDTTYCHCVAHTTTQLYSIKEIQKWGESQIPEDVIGRINQECKLNV